MTVLEQNKMVASLFAQNSAEKRENAVEIKKQ